jgi:hypothetical protein
MTRILCKIISNWFSKITVLTRIDPKNVFIYISGLLETKMSSTLSISSARPISVDCLSMTLQPFVGTWHLYFSSLFFYTVGRTHWTGDQPVARSLPTHRTAQTQNERTQTSMPQVRFEPTTPVFERTKTVRALDLAANVIGHISRLTPINLQQRHDTKSSWFSSELSTRQ